MPSEWSEPVSSKSFAGAAFARTDEALTGAALARAGVALARELGANCAVCSKV
jgi:hypothetical protein